MISLCRSFNSKLLTLIDLKTNQEKIQNKSKTTSSLETMVKQLIKAKVTEQSQTTNKCMMTMMSMVKRNKTTNRLVIKTLLSWIL